MENKKCPEAKVYEGARSVYEDLGYKNHADMVTKANLVLEISKIIKRKKLTQTQCGEILGISQPKLSELLKGIFRGYSVERLMHFLNLLGKDVTIDIEDKPKNRAARTFVRHHTSSKNLAMGIA